jgi:hypothetical protein
MGSTDRISCPAAGRLCRRTGGHRKMKSAEWSIPRFSCFYSSCRSPDRRFELKGQISTDRALDSFSASKSDVIIFFMFQQSEGTS